MSLTAEPPTSKDFFVAGGTLPLQSNSYVERSADNALQEALLKGRFCYVLNSRQMGKSSLCVRTMARLEAQGVKCAFVDITKIGGRNVTPEQWYAGLAVEVGRALNLRAEFLEYWKSEGHLSPMQRFFGALHDVALSRIEGKIVIFVDEIDSTRSLSFSSDEFFAGVRECFNRRVQEPAYGRMTFCFLGVAVPSDLIHDARTTPFNIGERIYLKDFTYDEVKPLAAMLGPNGEQVLKRVYHWSNGHPFLTQSICRALAEKGATSEKEVDDLIYRDLLEPKVRETNINLSDVGNRVLNGYADGDDIARFRADILSAYGKALAGKETLQDDESNRVTAVLKLSGLMRSEGKALRVRNRIYQKAFDKGWIRENMPGQELRRQKRAFYLGVARTAFVAAAVVAVIGYLAISNLRLAKKNAELALKSQYEAYVATMNLMPTVYEQMNLSRMDSLLQDHAKEPWKGMEWNFWDRMAHQAQVESPSLGDTAGIVSYSPDGKEVAVPDRGKVRFVSTEDGRVVRTVGTAVDDRSFVLWLPDSKRVVNFSASTGGYVMDAKDGKPIYRLPENFRPLNGPSSISMSGLGVGFSVIGNHPSLFNYETRKLIELPREDGVAFPNFSPDGQMLVVSAHMNSPSPVVRFVDLQNFKTLREVSSTSLYYPIRYAFLPDGKNVIVGTDLGRIAWVEVSTGKVLWSTKVSDSTIGAMSVSRDGKRLGFSTRNRRAFVYDIGPTGAKLFRTFPDANGVMLLPDGQTFATNYKSIKFYRLDAEDPVRAIRFGSGLDAAFARQTTGDFVNVVKGKDIIQYELVDGKLVLKQKALALQDIAAGDPNGFEYLTQREGRVVIRSAFQQGELLSMPGTAGLASIVGIGDDRVAFCLDGREIQLWDLTSKKQIRTLNWPTNVVNLYLDRQQGHLAVADQKNRLGLIDVASWKVIWDNSAKTQPEFEHLQGIRGLKFSRDGTLIVTASDDDTAALWDSKTGVRLASFVGHAQTVQRADISADNSRVATASDDQTVRLWDAKTGLELTTLGSCGNGVDTCTFTLDGNYVMTIAFDNVVRLWPITPRKLSAARAVSSASTAKQ